MAPKKDGKLKNNLQDLLSGLGLHGEFTLLIDKAIREGWDSTEFIVALTKSNPFRNKFPGLIERGGIAPFLNNGSPVISAGALGNAIRNYYNLQNSYEQAAKGLGFKVGPQRTAALIKAQVSPDEFGRRAYAVSQVRRNPELKDVFNQELVAAGQKPLDEQGFFKFLAGAQSRKFYDIYEAASLRSMGLQLDPAAALRAAKAIGEPGVPVNVEGLVSQVQATLSDVGPEIARQGISLEEAVVALGKGGQDAAGIGNTLRALMNQRRALGGYVAGTQTSRGPGGGLAQYTDEANNQLFAE